MEQGLFVRSFENIQAQLKDNRTVNDKALIDKNMRDFFVKKNQSKVDALIEEMDSVSVVKLPMELINSAAKIKVAFKEYLRFMDYEYIPNLEDLKDFTGGYIDDEDILNYELHKEMFVSLSEEVVNEAGESDTFIETFDDGSYQERETKDAIYESLNLLSKQDRDILMYKFGLDDHDELDNKQLATKFHSSLEEMEQKVSNALTNMRSVLETMI